MPSNLGRRSCSAPSAGAGAGPPTVQTSPCPRPQRPAPPGQTGAEGATTRRGDGLRWELSAQQRLLANSLHGDWSPRSLLATLARAPQLVPYVARQSLRAAATGIHDDVELAVLIDSERVRQALPGTVRGAGWSDDGAFLDELMARIDPGWRVLEIGCGVGRLSRKVAPKVRELVCSDASEIMVREAASHLAGFDNVQVLQSKGYWLDNLADDSFDAVYAHAVFCFFDVYPAMAMLDAVRRVLRPGGTSFIGFWTIDRPDWADGMVQRARRSRIRGSFGGRALRRYTEPQIRAMCEAVGLGVTRCDYISDTSGDHSALLVQAVASGTPSGPPVAGRSAGAR
jgi:SAM-dependent methyltransferase